MKSGIMYTLGLVVLACSPSMAAPSAEEILQATGVEGGLVVQIGCTDGQLAAGLRASDAFLVQGLDTDPANVAKARAHFQSLGLAGKVTAGLFDGKNLPFVDDFVNLVVAEDLGDVSQAEVMRVLCPGGVAYVKKNGAWSTTKKPWPEAIDEWTHYLYDPQGSSVSKDVLAGHPRGLRWTGGPFWARSHEHTASMQAMVSAAGRVFYVMDEGPVESIQLPSKMVLTARDAFNGTVLWKRPLHNWWNALFPLKSGPGWLPRRLVAVDDRVYIAPGIGQDVLCLDAASGKIVREYADTASTFELLVSDGLLLAAVQPDLEQCDYKQEHPDCWKERDRASVRWGWNRDQGTSLIKAIGAEDGQSVWERKTPVVPMTLTSDGKMVCYYDGDSVAALDRKSGEVLWQTDVPDMKQVRTGYSGPRMVLAQGRVLLSPMGNIVTMSAETGDILWAVNGKPRSGHYSLEDFYVIDDKIWALGRQNKGTFTLYSLETGEKLEEISNPIDSFYIHQRCYPGRATSRYQLPPIMGTTVYDMVEDSWSINDWVRGGCIYGAMPANGMIYATPHACACYYQSKLNGFNAIAPEPQSAQAPPAQQRLVKGPAYGTWSKATDLAAAWPTFRHDNSRTGYIETDVSSQVEPKWKKALGTKLSQPVVGEGKVLFSAVDEHVVYALDADSGKEAWHFNAGGRVNSPPTLHAGLALFGCADGCVYAVNAADGQLAWKFRAAPNDRQMMSYGQLESVWPLAGNVLIEKNKLYCVAGRSMFLDGGLRMVILDPKTGELVAENVMDRQVPGTDGQLDDLLMGKHMPVAMPDILSSDGQYVYMKSQTFTMDGKRVRVRPQRPDTQYDEEVHLFSPISFLDDGWHQRTYWIYGRAAGEGWAEFQLPPKRVPCGRIMCIDEDNAYSYARDLELMCNTSVSEYRLFSAGKYPSRKVGIPKLEGTWVEGKYSAEEPLAAHTVNWKALAEQPKRKLSALDYNWVHEEPDVMAKAMVLANDRLFLAGPRDVVDEKKMWGRSNEPIFQAKMAEQASLLAGEQGGVLQVYSKQDGQKLAEHELEYLPAFDGLIAAEGRLYMVTECGALVCYEGK
jgi:outer membrane protein assembly factor BamB